MKPFDFVSAPLEGANLIEASAGTGKTYTLTGLFLRLLLEKGLRIEQILVVTYTNAATAELKERIRTSLRAAQSAFENQDNSNPLIGQLMNTVKNHDRAITRIQNALIDFDRAAIFTIHGFCQRLLQSYAFETGRHFQTELVQDASLLIQETVDDFWRRHISSAPPELAAYTIEKVRSPERLAETLNYSRYLQIKVIPKAQKPTLSIIKQWRQVAEDIVTQWDDARNKVRVLLEYEGLNALYYGKCTPLKQTPNLTHRHIRIDVLCHAMDRWEGQYPLFDQFDRFTASHLRKATKKGFDTPRHRFFDCCDHALLCYQAMEKQMALYLQYLRVRLLEQAQEKLAIKKEHRNLLFFDDLLLHVHKALSYEQGPQLVNAIRSQYRAALVDEFQDTDPLQYRIFFRLFAKPPHLLALIGDPKQAIYGFRGADLFSYIQAVERADHRATLTHNWRSTPGLVDAINTVFQRHAQPFGLKRITFERVMAGVAETHEKLPALNLWYMDSDDQSNGNRIMSQTAALPRIVNAVAQEIVDLLYSTTENFFPEDIAILTRTHYQAKMMKAALVNRQVPAVLHSAGLVFDSVEAQEMRLILNAAAMPSDPVRVRAALCTKLLGVDAGSFSQDAQDMHQDWHSRWAAFHSYHQLWSRYGFFRMFRQLMANEGVKVRVLALPEGERRMTNILHLAELLHHAESSHRLGPEGLIKWLKSGSLTTEKGRQDQQLRLESDARAVRIITMHKSKGLQFKVVFCPFTWSGVKIDESAVVFHHSDEADALTLALGPGIATDHKLQAQKEMLAENLRLLYVALTRAQLRCYWIWGRIKGTEVSAPAYLLHGPTASTTDQDWISALRKKMSKLTHHEFISDLNDLVKNSKGTIGIAPLPQRTVKRNVSICDKVEKQSTGRVINRKISNDWRIASFSAMTAGLDHAMPEQAWEDRDAGSTADDLSKPEQNDAATLFSFPKGVQAGLFFHDLLEHWDPNIDDAAKRRALVGDKLRDYRLEDCWIDCVDRLLIALAQAPLKDARQSFSLGQVGASDRLNEMAFYYRLRPIDARQLKAVFEQFAANEINPSLSAVWRHLRFDPVQGYLKGYIDTLLRYKSRYYVIDWKSNYLGPAYADYQARQLAHAMVRKYYFLQYHLYTVALDQLLRNRLPGYDYAKNFGGVFYIFLRGIQADATASTGVFYDLPNSDLVDAMNRLLIAN
jgi:exodeoxyribonuclease V beta subunit